MNYVLFYIFINIILAAKVGLPITDIFQVYYGIIVIF